MEQSKPSPFGQKLMEAICRITTSNSPTVDGPAEIWSEGMLLKPRQGMTIYIPYTETTRIEPANYRVNISKPSADIVLSSLGTRYDGFSQKLVDTRGDALVSALLMKEPNIICETRAFYTHTTGSKQFSAACRARICPTSLILIPAEMLPLRIPLSFIKSVDAENFKLKITTSKTGIFELSRMGNAFQYFLDSLTGAQRALEATAIEAILEMLPSATSDEIQTLAKMMPEGWPAARKDIETISKELWKLLETKVNDTPLAQTYDYLTSIGEAEHAAIGLKKTMKSTYVWFLVPITGTLENGGNTLAMEIVTEKGHATYLFRVLSRKSFTTPPREEFLRETERLAETLSEAMIATGFRREPIYLDDERLLTEAYRKYLFAAGNLSELKLLRRRFYARTIHRNFENWKQNLHEALRFNTSAESDDQRWSASNNEPEEKDEESQ